MAYDENLAERVRTALKGAHGWSEKKMFGGLCFLHRGHMACGLVGEVLMVRVGPEDYAAALKRPHARAMDFTGKPLKGMVYVDPPGIKTAASLKAWIERSRAFTASLPPKKG